MKFISMFFLSVSISVCASSALAARVISEGEECQNLQVQVIKKNDSAPNVWVICGNGPNKGYLIKMDNLEEAVSLAKLMTSANNVTVDLGLPAKDFSKEYVITFSR